MKTAKLLSLLILGIALLSFASATIVVKGYFGNDVDNTVATINEGESATLKVIFTSLDTITQKNIQFPAGVSSDGDCTFSGHTYTCIYSVSSNDEGTYSIKIIGKDNANGVDNSQVTLIVLPKTTPSDNVKPVITILGNNPATVYQGNTYSDNGATAYDNVDGDITSEIYTSSNVNTNVVGNYQVTYSVSDEAGNSASATRTVKVIAKPYENHAPKITSTPDKTTDEGDYYSYQVTATDADNDALSYSFIQHPSWLYISSNGLIAGTAPEVDEDTDYAVVVRVSDGKASATQTYTLSVEDTYIPSHLPTINVISPIEDKTYKTEKITFKVETDGDAVYYILDGESKVYMDGDYNNVFTESVILSKGEHEVTFYAINEHGKTSKTVEFSVKVGTSGCSSNYTPVDFPSTKNGITTITGTGLVIANTNKKADN